MIAFSACNSDTSSQKNSGDEDFQIEKLFSSYYEKRLHFFPLEATQNGDHRFDDLLPNYITQSYRDTLKAFYSSTLDSLNLFRRENLSDNNQVSYDILKWDMEMAIEGLKFPDHLMPINQFWS